MHFRKLYSMKPAIILLLVVVYALVAVVLRSGTAQAMSPEQKKVLDSGIRYFNTEDIQCTFRPGGSTGGANVGNALPNAVPEVWRNLIMGVAGQYPDVDPRLVAAVLWIENRGWPEYKTSGWSDSSAGAQGPWQFIPSTWASMGHDGDGDGVKDPNNPKDAVHAAFKHHAGSAGKPVAVTGYTGNNPETDFQTTVFNRRGDNLLYYAAKYNGSGAPDGQLLKNFPRGQNADYVIMAYWLLASNFETGVVPQNSSGNIMEGSRVDAKTTGALFGSNASAPGGAGTSAGGLAANSRCPLGNQSSELVGELAWPVDKSFYDEHPVWFTKPHHDYPASDIPVPTGTNVYAMLRGRVVSAPTGGTCGQGVTIDTPPNIRITYCHGTDGGSVDGAHEGDEVQAGALIMHSDDTGRSSGPHLHVQIKIGGVNHCPQPLFQGMAAGTPPDLESLPTSGCTN